MTIENTKSTRDIRNVAATMAIENMHLSKAFVEELVLRPSQPDLQLT